MLDATELVLPTKKLVKSVIMNNLFLAKVFVGRLKLVLLHYYYYNLQYNTGANVGPKFKSVLMDN